MVSGVIRKLREKGIPLPYFILATAYDQYAIEAFTVEAMDYLLKPIEKDRLAVTIDRARRAIAEKAKAEQQESRPRYHSRSAAADQGTGEEQQQKFHCRRADVIYATIDDGSDHDSRDST